MLESILRRTLPLVALVGIACGSDSSSSPSCAADTDCKGERVCVDGKCEGGSDSYTGQNGSGSDVYTISSACNHWVDCYNSSSPGEYPNFYGDLNKCKTAFETAFNEDAEINNLVGDSNKECLLRCVTTVDCTSVRVSQIDNYCNSECGTRF